MIGKEACTFKHIMEEDLSLSIKSAGDETKHLVGQTDMPATSQAYVLAVHYGLDFQKERLRRRRFFVPHSNKNQ